MIVISNASVLRWQAEDRLVRSLNNASLWEFRSNMEDGTRVSLGQFWCTILDERCMPADSEQARVCRLKTLIVTHTQESMRARDRQLRVINRQKFEYHTSCYKLLCDCFKFFSKKKIIASNSKCWNTWKYWWNETGDEILVIILHAFAIFLWNLNFFFFFSGVPVGNCVQWYFRQQ